ncbi:MAG: hypothetical protein GY797_30985, partial [Deltaproteobacteria bacterium]|nr:hypothetical protein [Deltaproteobacteria bacterium]
QPPELSSDQIEAIDPEAAISVLRDLLELLKKRNSKAMNTFQVLKKVLRDPRFHDKLRLLDKAIYSLQYKESMAMAFQLIEELEKKEPHDGSKDG